MLIYYIKMSEIKECSNCKVIRENKDLVIDTIFNEYRNECKIGMRKTKYYENKIQYYENKIDVLNKEIKLLNDMMSRF